jgi:plasmid stabilization system protein ParE
MRCRVVFLRTARAHLREAGRFWRENRANPELLQREVDTAVALLMRHPNIGHPAPSKPGVRRLLLRKTQHYVYYRVDQAEGVVRIVAFWHTARRGNPAL